MVVNSIKSKINSLYQNITNEGKPKEKNKHYTSGNYRFDSPPLESEALTKVKAPDERRRKVIAVIDFSSSEEGQLPGEAVGKVLDVLINEVDLSKEPYYDDFCGLKEQVLAQAQAPMSREQLAECALLLKKLSSSYTLSASKKEVVDALRLWVKSAWARCWREVACETLVQDMGYLEDPDTFRGKNSFFKPNIGIASKTPLAHELSIKTFVDVGMKSFSKPNQEKTFRSFKMLEAAIGGTLTAKLGGSKLFDALPQVEGNLRLSLAAGHFKEPGSVKRYVEETGFKKLSHKCSIENDALINKNNRQEDNRLAQRRLRDSIKAHVGDRLVDAHRPQFCLDKLERKLNHSSDSKYISDYEKYQQASCDQVSELKKLLKSTLGVDSRSIERSSPSPKRSAAVRTRLTEKNLTGFGVLKPGGGVYLKGHTHIKEVKEKKAYRLPVWDRLSLPVPFGKNAYAVKVQRGQDVFDSLRPIFSHIKRLLGVDLSKEESRESLRSALKKLEEHFDRYTSVVKNYDNAGRNDNKNKKHYGDEKKKMESELKGELGNHQLSKGRRHSYIQYVVLIHAAIGMKLIDSLNNKNIASDEHYHLSEDKKELDRLSKKFQSPDFGYDEEEVLRKITFFSDAYAKKQQAVVGVEIGLKNNLLSKVTDAKGKVSADLSLSYADIAHSSNLRHGKYHDITLRLQPGVDVNELFANKKFNELLKDLVNMDDLKLAITDHYGIEKGIVIQFREFKPTYKSKNEHLFNKGGRFETSFIRIQSDTRHHARLGVNLSDPTGEPNITVGGELRSESKTIKTQREKIGCHSMDYLAMRFNRFKKHDEISLAGSKWLDYLDEQKKQIKKLIVNIANKEPGLNEEMNFIFNKADELKQLAEKNRGFSAEIQNVMNAVSLPCKREEIEQVMQAYRDNPTEESYQKALSSLTELLKIQYDNWWYAYRQCWEPQAYAPEGQHHRVNIFAR